MVEFNKNKKQNLNEEAKEFDLMIWDQKLSVEKIIKIPREFYFKANYCIDFIF